MSEFRLIFVVGTARAGTTLTARILGGHPLVLALAPAETNFFEDIWARRVEFGNIEREDVLQNVVDQTLSLFGRYNLPERQALVNSIIDRDSMIRRSRELGADYPAVYLAFAQLLAEHAGKPIFCDDTPKHLFHMEAILSTFPQAQIVCCVRDPRAFLYSYKHLWERSAEGDRIKHLYHPIVSSLLWRSAANQIVHTLRSDYQDRVTLVRYESLVQSPKYEVEKLCRFLGLSYDDDMLRVEQHNSSFEQSSSSGIFGSSLLRWQEGLSADEIWLAQRLNQRTMAVLGYRDVAVRASLSGIVRWIVTTPHAMVRALWVNRAKRGPLFQYIVRRIKTIVNPT